MDEQIIKTIDEEGNKVELRLVDIVSVDDVEYALLTDTEEVEGEESEVVLMRLKKNGEEYVFEAIEDDDEFELVAQAIIDEQDEEDEDEEQ